MSDQDPKPKDDVLAFQFKTPASSAEVRQRIGHFLTSVGYELRKDGDRSVEFRYRLFGLARARDDVTGGFRSLRMEIAQTRPDETEVRLLQEEAWMPSGVWDESARRMMRTQWQYLQAYVDHEDRRAIEQTLAARHAYSGEKTENLVGCLFVLAGLAFGGFGAMLLGVAITPSLEGRTTLVLVLMPFGIIIGGVAGALVGGFFAGLVRKRCENSGPGACAREDGPEGGD